MSKGKFSKSSGRDPGRDFRSPWSQDMDQTTELPDLSQPSSASADAGPIEDRDTDYKAIRETLSSMPEADFHNLTDEELAELAWLEDIPEFSHLELPRNPVTPAEVPQQTPAPESPFQESSEDQQIEEAFQQVVEKERGKVPKEGPSAFSQFLQAKKKSLIVTGCILLALVILGSALGILVPLVTDPYNRQILSGVTVAGVDLGGLSKADAEKKVEAQVLPVLAENDMVLTLPIKTVTLSAKDADIQLDVKGAVKAAYRYGRTGSKGQRDKDYRNSLTQTHAVDLVPYLRMNDSYVQGQLKTYTLENQSVFSPSSYALEGEQPPLIIEDFNENNTCQTLLLNLGTPDSEVHYETVKPQILAAYGKLSFALTITPEQTGALPEPLDLQKIQAEISLEPVDATMDPETFEVISGSYGYTFDLNAAQALLDEAHYGDTVRVPMEYVAPEVTDEDVLFADVLSEVETPHGKNENRNTNLRLACEAINGLILYPGDEFSYNETLGQRTEEKGYKPAPAYSGNRLIDSFGGGICQVSSTLYYSCLLADMEITDRINHGVLPTYIDPGMDATVSWGGPDYKFRNSSNFPIKILAETTEDKVIVKIMGTDDRDYYVKMEYSDSVTKAGTISQECAPGTCTDGAVLEGGHDGHFVKTYRCKYDKVTHELISREPEANSNYPAKPAVVASVPSAEPPAPVEPETPEPQDPEQPPAPPETEGSGQSGGGEPGGNSGGDSGSGEVPLPPVPDPVVPPENGTPPDENNAQPEPPADT